MEKITPHLIKSTMGKNVEKVTPRNTHYKRRGHWLAGAHKLYNG